LTDFPEMPRERRRAEQEGAVAELRMRQGEAHPQTLEKPIVVPEPIPQTGAAPAPANGGNGNKTGRNGSLPSEAEFDELLALE